MTENRSSTPGRAAEARGRQEDLPPNDAAGRDGAQAGGVADLVAGAIFAGFGVAALVIGRNQPIGSAVEMGPGYVPRVLAWGLAAFGVLLAGRGAMAGLRSGIEWHLRPILTLSAAILVYAFGIERLGLVLTAAATVLVTALAQPGIGWRYTAAATLGLPVFVALLFGWALGLPFGLWPR
jgi:Tripartite tricarboxylate transporter TctB family